MRFTRVLLMVAGALGLASQALLGQAVDWRFAHPQATAVGGLRVSTLLQSPLLKTALEQGTTKNPQAAMGIAIVQNLLAGITEVRFSIVDNGTANPDMLLLVSGALDPNILAMLQGDSDLQPLGKAPAPPKMESYRVNATTFLLGTGASLKSAIARLSQDPADLSSAAFVQAGLITAGHDLWLAGQIPNIPGFAMPAGFNLQGIALGMSFTNNIALEIAAQTATAEQAASIVKMMRDAESKQPAAGAVRPEISVEGTTARLRVSVPADQVMEALKNPALTGLLGGTGAAQPAVPPPAPPKPSRQTRGTIIIEGLEGGPLEFPIDGPEARPGTVRR